MCSFYCTFRWPKWLAYQIQCSVIFGLNSVYLVIKNFQFFQNMRSECHLGQVVEVFLMCHIGSRCDCWFIQATKLMYYVFIWPKTHIFKWRKSQHFHKILKLKLLKHLKFFDLCTPKSDLGQHRNNFETCTICLRLTFRP